MNDIDQASFTDILRLVDRIRNSMIDERTQHDWEVFTRSQLSPEGRAIFDELISVSNATHRGTPSIMPRGRNTRDAERQGKKAETSRRMMTALAT